jgi:hypothetical protein
LYSPFNLFNLQMIFCIEFLRTQFNKKNFIMTGGAIHCWSNTIDWFSFFFYRIRLLNYSRRPIHHFVREVFCSILSFGRRHLMLWWYIRNFRMYVSKLLLHIFIKFHIFTINPFYLFEREQLYPKYICYSTIREKKWTSSLLLGLM